MANHRKSSCFTCTSIPSFPSPHFVIFRADSYSLIHLISFSSTDARTEHGFLTPSHNHTESEIPNSHQLLSLDHVSFLQHGVSLMCHGVPFQRHGRECVRSPLPIEVRRDQFGIYHLHRLSALKTPSVFLFPLLSSPHLPSISLPYLLIFRLVSSASPCRTDRPPALTASRYVAVFLKFSTSRASIALKSI